MSILILVVSLTLIISAVCSLFEAVLYSMRVATLEVKEKESRLAARALKMKRNISEPIASILILNTVANTAGATVAGMYAAKVLGESRVIIFSILLTVCILFLSEILPKTMGAIYWRFLWPVIVWPITLIKFTLYPLVKIAQGFANIFSNADNVATVTEEEIKALVRVGAREGEISRLESDWVHNLIELEDKTVSSIMTPRSVMFSLDSELTIANAIEQTRRKEFSRIPVYEKTPDKIIGYVTQRELSLFPEKLAEKVQVHQIRRKIMFIPGVANALRLLMTFMKRREHIAIVIDEYGGVDGVVTLEDAIETILGMEIIDEKDKIADLQQYASDNQKEKMQ